MRGLAMGTRSLLAGIVVVCVIFGSACLGAAGETGPDAHPVQIAAYDITLTPDFENNSMATRVVCTVRNDGQAAVGHMDFDILAWEKRVGVAMEITGVSQRAGGKETPLVFSRGTVPVPPVGEGEWRQVPRITRVTFASPLEPRAVTDLVLEYTWRSLNTTKQDTYVLFATLANRSKEIELIADFTWLPAVAPEAHWPSATWRLAMVVPEGYEAVIPEGNVVNKERQAGGVVWHWQSCAPVVPQVLVGRYDRIVVTRHGKPVVFHLVKGAHDPTALENYAEFLSSTYDSYTKLFGPLGGMDKDIDIVESSVNGGHGAYLGYIDEAGRIERAWRQPADRYDSLGAHELAHTWWGIAVNAFGPGERFLHESLARFSEYYLAETQYGEDLFREATALSFGGGQEQRPIIYPDHDDVAMAYRKGSLVLNILRLELGDEMFFKALRTYAHDCGGRPSTFADFVAAFNKVTGKDLTEFFRRWCFEGGAPDYQVTSLTSEPGDGPWNTAVSIKSARRGVIDCPLELRMAWTSQRVTFRVGEGATDTFTYETPEEVVEVVVDPDHDTYQGGDREWIDKILSLKHPPHMTPSWYYRGLARAEIGRYDEALADISRAMGDFPALHGHYFRGAVDLLRKDAAAATQDFTDFVDIFLEDPAGMDVLAGFRVLTGDAGTQRAQMNEILRRLTGADIRYDASSSDPAEWDKTIEAWRSWWKAQDATLKLADTAWSLKPTGFRYEEEAAAEKAALPEQQRAGPAEGAKK